MRPVFRLVLVVAAITLAVGCAGSAASTPTQRDMVAYIPGASVGAFTIAADNGSIVANIGAPLEAVWRRIPKAYDSLAIPISLIEPKRHVVANEGVRIRQKLGSQRLSTYLECGTTQVGPNADSYEVYFTITTQLDSVAPSLTRMTTQLTAAAKPLAFSQDYSRCSSKVVLEKKLLDIVATLAK